MKKYKVLIVEDEQMLRDMYGLKLSKENFNVIKAEDGQDGLEKAKKENPDIILLDIMLPKIDGFHVLKELREQKKFKKTPIIMLTNLGQNEDKKRGDEYGATDYLVKANTTPNDVVKKINEIIKSK